MKMTITLDGAPDDFAPVLAGLGCVETTPPPPPLPDDPVTWFRSKLKAAGLHSEDVAAAVGLAPSGLTAPTGPAACWGRTWRNLSTFSAAGRPPREAKQKGPARWSRSGRAMVS